MPCRPNSVAMGDTPARGSGSWQDHAFLMSGGVGDISVPPDCIRPSNTIGTSPVLELCKGGSLALAHTAFEVWVNALDQQHVIRSASAWPHYASRTLFPSKFSKCCPSARLSSVASQPVNPVANPMTPPFRQAAKQTVSLRRCLCIRRQAGEPYGHAHGRDGPGANALQRANGAVKFFQCDTKLKLTRFANICQQRFESQDLTLSMTELNGLRLNSSISTAVSQRKNHCTSAKCSWCFTPCRTSLHNNKILGRFEADPI